MRKEPYSVGSYVHIVKRGARGTPIVKDEQDKWRFVLLLRHMNDTFKTDSWVKDLSREKLLKTLNRSSAWPKQEKQVAILSYCLHENHFHLLVKEIRDGGISSFMQRLGTSMANHFNTKYEEKGSLFQGAFRSRTIDSDRYLRYVSAYIQVKNTFELYPGGSKAAMKNFQRAYEWAIRYKYSSLGDYAGIRDTPIIDKDILGEMFTPEDFKSFAKDFMLGREGVDSQIHFE